MYMNEDKIQRINELARKKKTVGLTEGELTEQQALRSEYLQAFRINMQQMLEGVLIKEEDGSTTPLRKKRPN
jgi:uncharacterized protein YnzC (UPF0291/DUF896 family)